MIGNILKGRYEIIDELGAGGMGIVYLAYCSYLKRRVAIKVLLQDNEGMEESLLQEAKAAARLSHGNIVQIYDIFEEDNKTYIVMEYVKGKSLRQLISNQEGTPFTEQRALQLGLKLASALHHAHLNGVIHRDIKPDNIIIDQDGEPKITDFGIARISNDATIVHTDEILGSLRYSSPEQLKGSIVDERADIFSLGIVIFEMLTGTMPFPDDSPVTAAFKKLKESIPSVTSINSEVSIQAEKLVSRATALDPKERYRDMNDFYYAISDSLESPKTYYKKPLVARANRAKRASEQLEVNYKEEGPIGRGPGNVMIVLGLFMALITVVLLGVPMLKGANTSREVEVPNFLNLDLKEAQKLLDRSKLIGVVSEAISSESERGIILEQSVKEGELVELGSKIYFTVSKGLDLVKVPRLLGLSLEDAASLLKANDLQIGTVNKAHHDSLAKGLVISQEFDEDSELAPGSSVGITLSEGPKEEEVTVPNLKGYQLSTAIQRAQNADLKVLIEEVYSYDDYGIIIAQSLEEGEKVKKGTTITITASLGPLAEEEEDDEVEEVNYTFVVDPSTFSAGVEGSAIDDYILRAVLEDEEGSWELFSEYHTVTEGMVITSYYAPRGASYELYVDALGHSFHVGAGVIQ